MYLQEPQKPEPFNGPFNATATGPSCLQPTGNIAAALPLRSMGEDCLRINVHVPLSSLPQPDVRNTTLLPVLVFIHGGSFVTGFGDPGTYGPEYLVTKGVILVTFNYR